MTVSLPFTHKMQRFGKICGKNAKKYARPALIAYVFFWIIFQIFQPLQGDLPLYALRVMQFVNDPRNFYTDIFEVSTPMVFWLWAPVVWAALKIGFQPDHLPEVMHLYGLVWGAFAVWCSAKILRLQTSLDDGMRRLFLWCLGLSFLTLFNLNSFGDRDMLICLMLIPAGLMLGVRMDGDVVPTRWRVGMAFLATLAIMIKPQAVVIWAGFHAMLWWHYRMKYFRAFALETAVMTAAGIVYGLMVMWTQPDYIERILPMMMSSYHDYSVLWQDFPKRIITLAITALIIFYDAIYNKPHRTPFYPQIRLWLGGWAGGAIYVMVGNGWWYTYEMVYQALVLIGLWLFMAYRWGNAHQPEHIHYRRGMNGLVVVYYLFMMLVFGLAMFILFPPEVAKPKNYVLAIDKIEKRMQTYNAKNLAIIDDHTLIGLDLKLVKNIDYNDFASTYWMGARLNRDTGLGQNVDALVKHPLFHFIANSFVDDLVRRKPDMLLVALGYSPRMIDKLEYDPRFLIEMQNYMRQKELLVFPFEPASCHPMELIGKQYCVFRIYTRKQ